MEELNKSIEDLNQQKLKFENNEKFIKQALEFSKIEFNMGGVDLEPTDTKSIQNFKNKMLDKAMEFAEIKKIYQKLVNWKDVDEFIWLHFTPIIVNKYEQFHSIYSANSNDKNNLGGLYFIMGLFVALMAMAYMFK
jgi:hypothetical protein